FLIEARPTLDPKPIFSVCRPPDGKGANWLFENARLIAAQYTDHFARPLDAALEHLEEPSEARTSPIMEVIRDLAAQPFFTRRYESCRLIVVIDFLTNVPGYCQ